MERTKRKNMFRVELIIFLAVIAAGLLILWIRWENSHATYKNYDIVVKKNVYCEKTQTGRLDLQIRRKGGKKVKLLQTEQELKRSQSFQVVEDSYKLGIVDGKSAYDGNTYEQKYAGGTQYLTLYYVNRATSGKHGKMHLVMRDVKNNKKLINIKTSPKVKKDARRYEYRGKDLYVSEEGILLDAGSDEEFYNSQAMTAGLMTVCWKNGKEKQIQFNPNADVSEYEAADILVPKVTCSGDEEYEVGTESETVSEEEPEVIHYYYALELGDWENIREIKLGENVFAKAENLEKAADNLKKKKDKAKEKKEKEEAEKNAENQKKKEFYTTDMSLLNQPEDFHISDYYITNKVIAGNRYYVDENHVLWGQGMNYYAQLGINHPEDVGDWYHTEYTEPQKIAEHVVHVDASGNGYFMMYLTENGELYGAGANLQGVLGKEAGENDAMNPQQNVVNQPKLLMSDVSYMRAGATCAVALKKNGEVYWWGEYLSGEVSNIYGDGTLVYTEPHKMLDQAIYVTTANRRSAAITANGDLYTWGDNTYGQCGYTGEKTFLTEPEKVVEHVRMVWCDEIEQNSAWTDLANVNPNDFGMTSYDDTFVLTKDGKMYAAGTNIGTDSKQNTSYGEGEDDERSDENKWTTYSAKFLSIEVKEYVFGSDPSEEYTGEKEIQIEGTAAEGLAE